MHWLNKSGLVTSPVVVDARNGRSADSISRAARSDWTKGIAVGKPDATEMPAPQKKETSPGLDCKRVCNPV